MENNKAMANQFEEVLEIARQIECLTQRNSMPKIIKSLATTD